MNDPRDIVSSLLAGHSNRRVERIARAVMAAGAPANAVAEADASADYFLGRVANGGGLAGFTTVLDGDDSVIFTYDKDGSGSCSVSFGLIDGGEWGYTAYAGGDEFLSGTDASCEAAWKDLLGKMGQITKAMDKSLDTVAESNGARGHSGSCAISGVVDRWFARNSVFSPIYDSNMTYELSFTPDSDAAKRQFDDAVKAVGDRLSESLDVRISRNRPSIRVQLVNAKDMDYVKGVVRECGFDVDGIAGGR